MKQKEQYKYFAFISYSSKDTKWGKCLQKKLEGYRMPATLCSEHGWKRKPIRPVFFAPSDIQPGGLTTELQDRLKASRNLIVICSPNSAQSEWVGKEIAFFHSLGRANDIHFFIVDGIPHSVDKNTECFNPIIIELGLPEILGANIHEKIYKWSWLNKERAYVQLITKLLGVEFDSIWQRHRRLLIRNIITWCTIAILVLSTIIGVWAGNQPVDVSVALNEVSVPNNSLPPLHDAIVTMNIKNETKTDTIHYIDDIAKFMNLPHSAIGKQVKIHVECKNWLPVDTILVLGKEKHIDMARNPHNYGDVFFRLWNMKTECGVSNVKVVVGGVEAVSDQKGFVKMFIPLEKQSTRYHVICDQELEDAILNMPTTESTVLIVE